MTAKSKILWKVCGDCGDRMLEIGGERPEGPQTIAYGTSCAAHPPEKLGRPATMCLLMPVGFMAAIPEPPKPEPQERETPVPGPSSFGPVTRIATDLLVSWTGHGKGEDADDMRIEHAVDTARRILHLTGGG